MPSMFMTRNDLDRSIYRIFPIRRLLDTLEQGTIFLVPPARWDDPFENLLHADQRIANDRAYGQCWTFNRDTDAMWRIYSAGKDGVRVKTKPRRLLAALEKHVGAEAEERCFVGRVRYRGLKDLVKTINMNLLFTTEGSVLPLALSFKRLEFKHEREVRLIYIGDAGDTFGFSVDINDQFEEITFDPRMDQTLVRAYQLAIRATGYRKPINQSTLYRAPDLKKLGLLSFPERNNSAK